MSYPGLSLRFEDSNMPCCANCINWSEPGNYDEGFGNCCMGGSSSGEAFDKESKAVAQDYESYSAGLDTKPDFYCNQWEGKEQ